MTDIPANLAAIRQRCDTAAQAAGCDSQSINLIAVSKGHDEQAVHAALLAGQRVFGENRVQEAKAKFASLRDIYPDLELHLIGPLQTNKAEDAVELFDVIETIDRPRLAESVAAAIRKTGRDPQLYIEINIGGEQQKAGIVPQDLPGFLNFCRESCGLTISGLMCIPPQHADPEPFFLQLKQLADQHHLKHISMGMSADFETAIRCGATDIRVGSAIFGERAKPV